MVQLFIAPVPWKWLKYKTDKSFSLIDGQPVGPMPSGVHPTLFQINSSGSWRDDIHDELELRTTAGNHGIEYRIYELPVPLRGDQHQILYDGSNHSLEIIWANLLSRPSLKDAESSEYETNRCQLHFLRGIVGRIQDFKPRSDSNKTFLPWDQSIDLWLESGKMQDPTMNILVQHATKHLARWVDISDRPKRLLSRRRDMVSMSRVQELDTHCMTWLSRQPGRTVPERAGPRQHILALARYENVNVLENRVFRDLLELTNTEARDYLRQNEAYTTGRHRKVERYSQECRRLGRKLADLGINFPEEPVLPNYVLMQDERYSHVWAAWNELVKRERSEDDIWRWQRLCWAEFAKMTCGIALFMARGGEIEFASPLRIQNEYRRGRCVVHDNPLLVIGFRRKSLIIELLDCIGCSCNLPSELHQYNASFWLRIYNLKEKSQKYMAVWTSLAMAKSESLRDLTESANESIECIRRLQPKTQLVGGIVLQAEVDPSAQAKLESCTRSIGVSFGPFDEHLEKGLELLGEEIVKYLEIRL